MQQAVKRRIGCPIQAKRIEYIGRRAECRTQLRMFRAQIETIQSVKIDCLVAPIQEQCLPLLVTERLRERQRAFDDHDPGTSRRIRPTSQYRRFETLDIDLEPVHLATGMHREDLRQRYTGHDDLGQFEAALSMPLGNHRVGRRNAGPDDLEEVQHAGLSRDRSLDHRLVGPMGSQRIGIASRRFDMNTSPSALIEHQTDRIDQRVLCTDIDVKAAIDVRQRTPEHDIFKILGIGSNHLSASQP